MGFRLFGRGKDEDGEASCSRCGRTLLAGEWTQRLVDDDGAETYLCSLCVGAASPETDVADEATFEATPAGSGKIRSTRTDSDAFWRAFKEKDAEIERLESRLARAEAEKQELTAEIARLRDQAAPSTAFVPSPAAVESPLPTAVVTPPSTAFGPPPADIAPPTDSPAGADRTDPALGEKLRAVAAPGGSDTPSAPLAATPLVVVPDGVATDPGRDEPADDSRHEPAAAVAPAFARPPEHGYDDEDLGASLTILQRGIDLLNVSAVPRRIVETSESLGIPTVHVGSEAADTLLVTFLWTMGWYRFRVELADGGRVSLAERGYDELADMPPNATVRADGTVQIAAAMIKQASNDRGPAPRDPGPPAAPTTHSGTIISKSMMGQRTDDENVPPSWGSKNAPDFDWGR